MVTALEVLLTRFKRIACPPVEQLPWFYTLTHMVSVNYPLTFMVTAQKREQSLQDTPIAISVLTDKQLSLQGISSLGDLAGSTISSLQILPFFNAPSTLVMAIRGNGPGDIGQTTRDGSVAIYLDDIYLGRAQGLDMELAELTRIEVLRGPQGTLFGRNATGGAVSVISKRPTGEFGIRQTLSAGRFDQRSSITHIDLPEWQGLRTKVDYLYTEREGWVNNTAPNESDYNAYEKKGVAISLDGAATENLVLSYTYNHSEMDVTQNYFQLYRDFIGVFGDEKGRQSQTRLPITALDPTKTEQKKSRDI